MFDRTSIYLATVLFAAAALTDAAWADEATPSEPIIVYGRAIDQIGIATSASQGTVGYRDFEDRPMSRTGELVENVPGLIVTQHSSEGKANQYFLRGFNLDHGTDLAGFVDGVPINLRSHGHGQGYLDFNFLIPELIERIDFRKGPYFADVGDFSAAGTIAFKSLDQLSAPFAKVEIGEYGYLRGVAAGSSDIGAGTLLLGTEAVRSAGPWLLAADLKRYSGLAKYSVGSGNRRVSIALSAYDSRWTSTDQIPERAIASGMIDRFGFIDPDLGGKTRRIAVSVEGQAGGTRFSAYAVAYRLRLTSDFTYLLDDPVNGDEFQQRDRRMVYGGSVRHRQSLGAGSSIELGADARFDAIGKVGLYRSVDNVAVSTVRQDGVDEYGGGLYAIADIVLAPRLRIQLGLRGDLIGYDVRSDLPTNSGDGSATFLAPKASVAWAPTGHVELYANYGESFHSNDVRGATISVDPSSGALADRVDVFARARGFELGARWEDEAFSLSLSAFHLDLASELLFVGDAGATEPNDATRRYGLEASLFWRPWHWLTLDASGGITHARFRGAAAGLSRIPGAVSQVLSGGASVAVGHGLTGSIRLRHFGSASLVEDDSVRSQPTTLVNAGIYHRTGRLRLGLDLLNLFNSRDADISYFYASRLQGETAPVEDRHVHPVESRQFRASFMLNF